MYTYVYVLYVCMYTHKLYVCTHPYYNTDGARTLTEAGIKAASLRITCAHCSAPTLWLCVNPRPTTQMPSVAPELTDPPEHMNHNAVPSQSTSTPKTALTGDLDNIGWYVSGLALCSHLVSAFPHL